MKPRPGDATVTKGTRMHSLSAQALSPIADDAVEPLVPEDPSPLLIRTIALCAVEVLEGLRPVTQLGGRVTPEVLESVLAQRRLRLERQAVYRMKQRIVPSPGAVVQSRPGDFSVEAVVVMHTEARSFAVALRLEYIRGRWRATQLHVL